MSSDGGAPVVAPLKERLRAGGPLLGTFVKSSDPSVTEILARSGIDFLIADVDHSSLGLAELEAIVRAADLCAVPVVVRLPASSVHVAGRVLDAGAAGIQVCDVTDVATLELAYRSAAYAPLGRRSLSLSHRAARFGREPVTEYMERAGRELVLVGQVESTAGLDALPSLLQANVPVDAWFIGTLDLSASLGRPGQGSHPLVSAAVDDLAAAIAGAGARLAVFAHDLADACSWASRGAAMVVIGSDYSLFADAGDDLVRGWRAHLGTVGAGAGESARTPVAEVVDA